MKQSIFLILCFFLCHAPAFSEITEQDYLRSAQSALERKDLDSAMSLFNRMINQNPKFVEAYVNRGMLFFHQQSYDRAWIDFEKALKINSQHPLAHLGKGMVLDKQHKMEEAMKEMNLALELKPDFELAYYNRGVAYYEQKKYQESWLDIQKASEQGYPVDQNFLGHLNGMRLLAEEPHKFDSEQQEAILENNDYLSQYAGLYPVAPQKKPS